MKLGDPVRFLALVYYVAVGGVIKPEVGKGSA